MYRIQFYEPPLAHLILNEPIWHPASEAEHMRPEDPVLGVYLNNKAWALPWWIMKNHHVANLSLDSQPVLITLCEMCSSAAAFQAIFQERRLTFRLVGRYNGTILITDLETGVFWSPFTGKALNGSFKGAYLERLPLVQLKWNEWLKQNPTTLVLYANQELREGHGSRFSPGSPGVGSGFV